MADVVDLCKDTFLLAYQWRTDGARFWDVQTPVPEIPKTLKNRAKLSTIVKTVKTY